jgi:hypothetical protein
MLQQLTIKNPRKVPVQNGWHWINEGVRYFIGNKLTWMLSMFFVLFFAVFLVNFIPGAQLILLFVFPFITAGITMACADIENGNKMQIQHLLSAFSHPNRMNLFRYGLLLLLLIIIAQMIASIILGLMGVNFELISTELNAIKENQQASLQLIYTSPILLRFFVVTVISMLPIIMINILSPILLTFSNMTAWQAVKLSFVAGVKNLGAFALYAALYAGILLIVVFVLNLIMQLLFSIFGQNSLLAVYLYLFLFIMIVLALVTVSYSSAYVAFKDLFVGEEI